MPKRIRRCDWLTVTYEARVFRDLHGGDDGALDTEIPLEQTGQFDNLYEDPKNFEPASVYSNQHPITGKPKYVKARYRKTPDALVLDVMIETERMTDAEIGHLIYRMSLRSDQQLELGGLDGYRVRLSELPIGGIIQRGNRPGEPLEPSRLWRALDEEQREKARREQLRWNAEVKADPASVREANDWSDVMPTEID